MTRRHSFSLATPEPSFDFIPAVHHYRALRLVWFSALGSPVCPMDAELRDAWWSC